MRSEDAQALFKHLDLGGDGEITFEELDPWYENASRAAEFDAEAVQKTLMDRRTARHYDKMPSKYTQRCLARRAV